MPISSGTVSKGEKSKAKYQTLNLNNVFSQFKGESSKPNQQKSLFNKHGMSVLGKVPSARRPANLPSLKSEFSGNDPPVNLVPTGGSGWGKESGPTPATPTQQVTVPSTATTPPITINTSIPPPSISDKSWSAKIAGKPSNPPNYNTAHQSPHFNQEFPSLSGNVDVQYGPGPSLRPQTEGSWMQGGSHPQTNAEVGNQPGIVHVQDHPIEMLRPEVSAMLPSFMMKQEPQFTGFSNPPPSGPPRVAQPTRFSHDNRFMQHPPPSRREPLVQCAIVKEEDLSKLDDAKDGGWVLHDSIDYNQQLNFSDDEAEESENKENTHSSRSYAEQSALSETGGSHIEDEKMRKKMLNEIAEKAKVRKESEEQRFIESKQNATKKLEALTRKIEEKKENEFKEKEERKSTGQPVAKDGNEFRQLTQLGNDKPHSYKEPSNNFSSSRYSTSNKPPRLRKQEEMQHKGFYRQNQDSRKYYEGERDYERDRFREYDSRDRFNKLSNNRDFRSSGGYERKFSDSRSNYRDQDSKYQGRFSDSSDPSIDSRQRDSWERETPKRRDSDRSKQSYDDDVDRYRSDSEQHEKNLKEGNSWEVEKHDEFDGRWADQMDYDREDNSWEKEKRLERPQRPDSRESRCSRESKTSHSEHLRDDKLNTIDDPEDRDIVERERKPINTYKSSPYTRGSGVPITLEKLEAAESKQDKSSVLVPLVRSDKSGDYKKQDGKDEGKGKLDAWSTPLNVKLNEQKKEENVESVKQSVEEKSEKQNDELVDKENKNVSKEEKEPSAKKERGDRDRDVHHRGDRERSGRAGGGNSRYQGNRSNEWSNSYSSNYRGWSRDPRESSRGGDRRGHGRGPPSRNTYSRHPRSESDPESGKEERFHERDRRVEKGRKERDENMRYNDRYDRKERDRYYEPRNTREYSSQRGGGGRDGGNYRSSQNNSRRVEYGKNNFSGDEKKPRNNEKKDGFKENTSEDDKKEKKNVKASSGGNNKNERSNKDKDWESDGKESFDDDGKYKSRNSSTYTRSSRGMRNTYGTRKNEKFSKERTVKEESKGDLDADDGKKDTSGSSEGTPGSKTSENGGGFQEVRNKKQVNKENTPSNVTNASSAGGKKPTDEKNNRKENAPKSTTTNTTPTTSSKTTISNQTNSSKNGNSSNVSNKGGVGQSGSKQTPSQQQPGKILGDKSAKDGNGLTNTSAGDGSKKKQDSSEAINNEIKMHTYSMSMVKDLTGPPPPPPATNAWDRPLNAALKSASPAPTSKTQTPPPSNNTNSSSNAGVDQHGPNNANVVVDDSSQQHQQQQQQQQQQQIQQQQQQLAAQHHYQQQIHHQHQQQQKMEDFNRPSPQHQHVSEQQQQQLQAQLVQKQQQQALQQQVQQQAALDKIDSSLLDGTTTSVPTIIFENTNFKPVLQQDHQYRSKETMVMEDYKQQDLGCSKEDNSDMKLDFTTYGADLSSEDHKNSIMPHNIHMVQSSAVELNWKIASVKSVWDETEVKQPDVVSTFPPPHSGASNNSTHFNVVSAEESYKSSSNVNVVSAGGGGNPSVGGGNVDCSNEDIRNSSVHAAAAVAADMQIYASSMPRLQQHTHVNSYAANMTHKDQQQSELQKMSKQQMQAGPGMSTPPPQSYGQTHYQAAQYNALPSITSPQAATVLYNTPQLTNQAFQNYPLTDGTQILNTAPTRQNATQFSYPLNISQGLSQTFNQQPNLYIHQATTPTATSDLASQLASQGYHRIHQPGATYGSTQQLSTNPPPNTFLISNAPSVKQSNPSVAPIGSKSSYQPSQLSQMYIPTNMYDPNPIISQSFLSQTQQRQVPPSGSSFYSAGTGASSAQAPPYYQNQGYSPASPYGLSYGAQNAAPTGQQQIPSTMAKTVVGGKYIQPPPQQTTQQAQQVKYSSYPTGQPQLIQAAQQQGGPQQQTQVLITQATQQANQQ